jgi:hypothetical protein
MIPVVDIQNSAAIRAWERKLPELLKTRILPTDTGIRDFSRFISADLVLE